MKSAEDGILISGAREHNLQNVTVHLPRNALCVITGLSGSGKSSLAFDTLFAEGQRRYVESFSAYARQFLDQMQKPDVDRIDGLSPAIAIEQRTAGSNPRSIVATTTEIHDYLRLLYAAIGKPHCPRCGRSVEPQSAAQIIEQILQYPPHARLVLLAPVIAGKKGQHESVFEAIRKKGFLRVRLDGALVELDDLPKLDKRKAHTIDIVVDRLTLDEAVRPRLADSVELALREGEGRLVVLHLMDSANPPRETLFSENNACTACGISFEKLTARHFSFNSPFGACPSCAGLGSRLEFDENLVIPDPTLSIEDGAIPAWRRGGRRLILYYKSLLRAVARHYDFSLDTPFCEIPQRIRDILLHGSGDEPVNVGYWRGGARRVYAKPFEGILPNLARRYEETDSQFTQERLRSYMTRKPCKACGGSRLKPVSLSCTINGLGIHQVTALSAGDAARFFEGLPLTDADRQKVALVIKEIRERLSFLVDVGLNYLTLDRESGTLSGGEAQRIRLATQIGSRLVGVLYVLDEPSIGLHHRDNARLIRTLQGLRDLGNTVVVVEHDEETIRTADYVVDLGPGAGREGGRVMFAGTVPELLKSTESVTARYLRGEAKIEVPLRRKPARGPSLKILGAAENNLKNIDVTLPLGLLICVTGVSGSGKSTLVDDILQRALAWRLTGARDAPGRHRAIEGVEHIDKVIVIDQSPIGRTPRSNPATYTGAFTFIRDLFTGLPEAKVRGYGPGRFSFNVKGGRCETCKGDGVIRLEMHFLPDVYVPCESCRGLRYNPETLAIHFKGHSIADILNLTVDEGLEVFRNIPRLAKKLQTLSEVGLGYVQLGQSATTLSGGEAQRVKLATELSRQATGRTLYVLDEPTTGLHFADVAHLMRVLERLRDNGNTVLVIEHNLDVIKRADYIVDLGPEGGEAGGCVVAAGTPEAVAAIPESYTGQALKPILERR